MTTRPAGALLAFALLLVGCARDDSATPSPAPPPPSVSTATQIIEADAASPAVARALHDLALNGQADPRLRYLSLRRLHEAGPANAWIPTADCLATAPAESEGDRFLRLNAISLLLEAERKGKGERATEVLARLRASPETAATVKGLE